MATLCQFNITKMTAQEVFDEGTKHLLSQMKKSMNEEEACMYNSPDGLCCAAAPFLQRYNEGMEGESYRTVVKKFHLPKDHVWLISSLQRIHDSTPVKDWERELIELGESLGLIIKKEIFGKKGAV